MPNSLSGRITHPQGDGVIYGPGSIEQLGRLLARMGVRRPFVMTTPSVARAGLVDEVIAALGVEPAGRYDQSREHTPAPVVVDAAAQVGPSGADGLISIGGSSVVDLTKGVALVGASDVDLEAPHPVGRPTLVRSPLPHIAIPTTLSGAEFTSAIGITDPGRGEKRSYVDPDLAPRWVVLDPTMTRATPPGLWAATGMKILADGIETLCSTRATLLSDALAPVAIDLLGRELARSTSNPDDLEARVRCQLAGALILPHLVGVGLGLVAGLRHQLGGGLGIPHGVASTIVLPRVVRWNAAAAAVGLHRAAMALGQPDVDGLIRRIEALTSRARPTGSTARRRGGPGRPGSDRRSRGRRYRRAHQPPTGRRRRGCPGRARRRLVVRPPRPPGPSGG